MTFLGLLAIGCLLSCGGKSDDQSAADAATTSDKQAYQPKYRTIGHKILEIESKLGVPPDYKSLDEIIERAGKKIKKKDTYTKFEALANLKAIQSVLDEKKVIYKAGVSLLSEILKPRALTSDERRAIRRKTPFWEVFKRREIEIGDLWLSQKQKKYVLSHMDEEYRFGDCDTMALLYIAVGDAFDLPIRMVLLPDHAFIRWHFSDDDYLSYESTDLSWSSELDYQLHYEIPKSVRDAGVYMSSLDETAVLAHTHCCAAGAWAEHGWRNVALTEFAEAIKLNPKCLEAFHARGHLYAENSEWHKAVDDFTSAVNLFPQRGKFYVCRATALVGAGDEDRAIEELGRAIEKEPDLAEAYRKRAALLAKRDEHDAAIADFDELIVLDPEEAGSYVGRAMAYLDKKDYESALADCKKAIRLDPSIGMAYVVRARIHSARGKYDLALTDLDRALGDRRSKVAAYWARAQIHFEQDDHATAAYDYRRLLVLTRGDPEVRNNLAWLYITTTDPDVRDIEAGFKLARAAVRKSRKPHILDTLAAAYSEKDNFEKAIELEEEAASLLPEGEEQERCLRVLEHYRQHRPYREFEEKDTAEPSPPSNDAAESSAKTDEASTTPQP